MSVETSHAPAALPSLSPSRAADFKTCPLLYRLRSIDRLPEPPTLEQARGTLVHSVLERMFDLAEVDRTPDQTVALIPSAFADLHRADALFAQAVHGAEADVRQAATDLVRGYFALEDPRKLRPAARELFVHAVVDDTLLLRGYIDRLDVAPDGQLRVVDYKTGGAPREAFEARALFQLKFYALVLWRTRGTVPTVLRLLYLKDSETCDYTPDAAELARFERTLLALWRAIDTATTAGEFRPKPSRLCGWCAHQAHCPAYGGTPPPFPAQVPRQGPRGERHK